MSYYDLTIRVGFFGDSNSEKGTYIYRLATSNYYRIPIPSSDTIQQSELNIVVHEYRVRILLYDFPPPCPNWQEKHGNIMKTLDAVVLCYNGDESWPPKDQLINWNRQVGELCHPQIYKILLSAFHPIFAEILQPKTPFIGSVDAIYQMDIKKAETRQYRLPIITLADYLVGDPKVLKLLLLAQQFDPNSAFFKDSLPKEMFYLILYFAKLPRRLPPDPPKIQKGLVLPNRPTIETKKNSFSQFGKDCVIQ